MLPVLDPNRNWVMQIAFCPTKLCQVWLKIKTVLIACQHCPFIDLSSTSVLQIYVLQLVWYIQRKEDDLDLQIYLSFCQV